MIKDPQNFPKVEAKIFLSGPEGLLEVSTDLPKKALLPVTVIVCHPHPLFDGTMDNKVVTTVFRAFRNMGCSVLRFNYRGVGKSEGSYADAIGESDDLLAVMQWVHQVYPQNQIWLAGFSFGAYVVARVASFKENVKQLITIAPAVDRYAFKKLTPPACPWLVIQGDQDEVVSAQIVFQWVNEQTHAPKLIKVKDASHFFHGRLLDLRVIIEKEYQPVLQTLEVKS